MKKTVFFIVSLLLLASCAKKPAVVSRPDFSGDSAYVYCEKQMAFGPRVPNSSGHTHCAAWLVACLRQAGANVTIQRGTMTDYSGREQQILNLIGRFGDLHRPALLLAAHYDTRPWSDEETEYSDRYYNVPGANDGASGVGVLLEVARQIGLRMEADSTYESTMRPVEIVFFDCEDMGTPSFYTGQQRDDTWCLGSQLWAERQLTNPQAYEYGVLLDMVGAPDAVFPREYYSEQFAQNYAEQIWRAANRLGYGRYFSSEFAYPITDDHLYVNRAGVPCVDIIHYDARSASGFPQWWHTRNDDMSNVSRSTLQAVGEVIMTLL